MSTNEKQTPAADKGKTTAAPVTLATKYPELKDNRIAAMFDAIHFSPVTRAQTEYKVGESGTTKKIAGFTLRFANGIQAVVPGNVYAKRLSRKAPVKAECTILGQRNAQAITPLDQLAGAELNQIRAWAAQQFVAWRKASADGGNATIKEKADVGVALDGFEGFEDDEPATPAGN